MEGTWPAYSRVGPPYQDQVKVVPFLEPLPFAARQLADKLGI